MSLTRIQATSCSLFIHVHTHTPTHTERERKMYPVFHTSMRLTTWQTFLRSSIRLRPLSLSIGVASRPSHAGSNCSVRKLFPVLRDPFMCASCSRRYVLHVHTPHAHVMLYYCMPYSMNMGMCINMALCEKYCRALNLVIFSKKKQILMRIS